MGFLDFFKNEKDKKIDNIYSYNTKINSLLEKNKYIARSEYKNIIDDYKETYSYFDVLKSSNLLKSYC